MTACLWKDMFDVFSNWMFLKFMAASDKISKEILSPPHPNLLIYNTLITAAERHQGQSCPPTSFTNHSSPFRRCTFSQQTPHLPRTLPPVTSSSSTPLLRWIICPLNALFAHLRGSVKQPLIFLQCVIFKESDFILSLQVFRMTHCTPEGGGQASQKLED